MEAARMMEEKPAALPVLAEHVPETLRRLPQWVCRRWTWDEDRDEWKKVPMNAVTGKFASSTKPETWCDYARAVRSWRNRSNGMDGLGFVVQKGERPDSIVVFDLDDCRDAATEKIEDWAGTIVTAIDSYAELSPSATGVRIFAKGDLPENHFCRKGPFEVYDNARYVTVTGHVLGKHTDVQGDRTEAVTRIYRQFFPQDDNGAAKPIVSRSTDVEADRILRRAFASAKGNVIRQLFEGRTEGYSSSSEADLALCNYLAFWCGPDEAKIDVLFRQSHLYRPKWDQRRGAKTYGQRTIGKALSNRTEFYRWQANGAGPSRPITSAGERDETPLHNTDLGNCRRLTRRHGDNIRYAPLWDKWMDWTDRHWQTDAVVLVEWRTKETIELLLGERSTVAEKTEQAKTELDRQPIKEEATKQEKAERKQAEKRLKDAQEAAQADLRWALKSQMVPRIKAAAELAKTEPNVPVLPERFDQDPWLFNCWNGTAELKGEIQLREHRRQDYITKLCHTSYDPEATAPRWCEFLNTIMAGDDGLITFLRRFFGYCLTGDVSEQILPIFWGAGDNGKSTLLTTICDMMGGDYAMQANSDFLMAKNFDAHPTDKADLFGKRLVICSETESNRRLSESLVKQLTGGERIRARRMREDFWEFRPTHKIVLMTNHKPVIRGTDRAIWRRIRLVPFSVVIPEEKRDPHFADKLKEEYPGILAWCVRGCMEWQQHGLGTCAEIMRATSEYREEQDFLGNFLAECCLTGDSSLSAKAVDLFSVYKKWCETNSEQNLSQTKFGRLLTERGFEKEKRNIVVYKKIGIKNEFI